MKKQIEWKKFNDKSCLKYYDCFWQKKIYDKDEKVIFANLEQYTLNDKKIFELFIQISENLSITGKTINITNFIYEKLDFKLIDKHAKSIIKNLIICHKNHK